MPSPFLHLNDPKSPESCRQCNSCNICCVHVPVEAPEIGLSKPIGKRCGYLGRDGSVLSGCLIHESRLHENGTPKVSPGLLPVLHQDAAQPACCREYECGYKLGFLRGPESRPDKSGILFEEMIVHVPAESGLDTAEIRFLMGYAFREKDALKRQFGLPQYGRGSGDDTLYVAIWEWLDREMQHYAAALAKKFPEQLSANIIPYEAEHEGGSLAGGIKDGTPVVRCVASAVVRDLELSPGFRRGLGLPDHEAPAIECATSQHDYYIVRKTIEATVRGEIPIKMKDGDFRFPQVS